MNNLSQTKLISLTMKLDLKSREYKELCDELEQLKECNIDPNDKRLLELKELFQKNHDEIVKINGEIRVFKGRMKKNFSQSSEENIDI